MQKIVCVLANFGGPRDLNEVRNFLEELLTDQDVVRTGLLPFFHRLLFRRVAKKRSKKIAEDYEGIGGRSPIFFDTEELKKQLEKILDVPILTFHRYLPETHAKFLEEIQAIECDQIRVFPLFPQFTYATTGSIARFFDENLPPKIVNKIRWVKSYAEHPAYIEAQSKKIEEELQRFQLKEEEVFFLFSAHGVPQKFIESGDPYLEECRNSFQGVMRYFPKAEGLLCFQSKFGPDEWLKPYTEDVCGNIDQYELQKKHVVFIPISFTSDHIETLYEIEKLYLPIIKEKARTAYRADALSLHSLWISAIKKIWTESNLSTNQMLIRKKGCKEKCPSCKKICRR